MFISPHMQAIFFTRRIRETYGTIATSKTPYTLVPPVPKVLMDLRDLRDLRDPSPLGAPDEF